MRTLKFRAWYNGQMEYSGFHISAPGVIWAWEDHTCTNSKELNAPVMQFTGLLDKNGKEIYEGDIVEWDVDYEDAEKDHDPVEFKEGAFYPICTMPGELFEVIGNIHETPELL